MKEMIYQKDRKREVLDTGFCFGYLYYILNLGTHPTAYIKIPKNSKYFDKYICDIEVHGGITYTENYLYISGSQKLEGYFIGWDYAHAGDYAGDCEDIPIFKNDKKWTTQEIYEEVKEVCYQLIELENNSLADKMFEKLGYSKYLKGKNRGYYRKEDCYINLYLDEKRFTKLNFYDGFESITMQELQAINEKVKEVGWIE